MDKKHKIGIALLSSAALLYLVIRSSKKKAAKEKYNAEQEALHPVDAELLKSVEKIDIELKQENK